MGGETSRVNSALNVMRASAAILVCVGHVRNQMLSPLVDTDGGVLLDAAYAVTGLGHGAVMVFFVLSGFFVGGSVIRQRNGFKWNAYLVARSLRLGVVLVPALVLTFLADRTGTILFGTSGNYQAGSNAVDH